MVQKLLLARSAQGGSQSYTTPGTYYWTAPVGITKVDVTGQGGSNGSTSSWTSLVSYRYVTQGVYTYNPNPPGTNLGTAVSISSVNSTAQGLLSQWNSVTTSTNGASYTRTFYNYYYKSSTQEFFRGSSSYTGIYRRTGTVSINTISGSGNLTSSTSVGTSASNIQRLVTSTTYGGDSTAFGQTFSRGGSQSTVTDISVTAGTQYTIVVGTDQGADTAFISFDYS